MDKLKSCPFCGAPVNVINGKIFGWHKADCFFQLLDEHKVDMSEEEINDAFVKAWDRRANDD